MVVGIFVCIVLGFIVVAAWAHSKITGILVTAAVVIGVLALHCWYRATHEPYLEPPSEQPHAVMKFAVMSDFGTVPTYTVWIDDRDIDFAKRRTAFRGGFLEGLNGEGEYDVRASAGIHEIRVSYSALKPGATSSTNEDLKLRVTCSAGETLFFMLSDLGGIISLRKLAESEFAIWAEYLRHSPDERMRSPYLLEEIMRVEQRKLVERLVDKKLEEMGASEDEKKQLRPKLIHRLEVESYK